MMGNSPIWNSLGLMENWPNANGNMNSNSPIQPENAGPGDWESAVCKTGVPGLDEILSGGVPCNSFLLIEGDPGSGKTTLALQFLMEGVRRGERTLYITLSEARQELINVAHSHGWSLDGIELLEMSSIESLIQPEAQTTVFHPAELEMGKVSQLLVERTRKLKPTRVVFDSLSEFRLLAGNSLRYRRQLLALKAEFAASKTTTLLLDDKMEKYRAGSDPHILSLSHGVVEMEQLSPDYGVSRRRLRVLKLRGVKFREGYHDYIIETGGVRVFPRLVAAEHHVQFKREPIASGVKELDALLGGGVDRGTTTLILGAAGTGKSTISMQYARVMAERGEKGMMFAFDETRDVMLSRAKSLGLDLEKHIASGTLTVQQVDPAELSPGEFANRIRQEVEAGCKLVTIDSLNGYLNAMPGERYLANQLHELCAYLNQKGVATLLVLAQHGLLETKSTPVDLSYLADTVVMVRFFENQGEVKQAISVIKKRTGSHERTIREFKLELGKGIRVGRPLTEFQGVLTGAPTFHGKAGEMLNTA